MRVSSPGRGRAGPPDRNARERVPANYLAGIAVVVAFATVLGCRRPVIASPPTWAEVRAFEYGPAPANPAQAIRAHFAAEGADQGTPLMRVLGVPSRGHYRGRGSETDVRRQGGSRFGWMVVVKVSSASPSSGVDGGWHFHRCWFDGDRLAYVKELSEAELRTYPAEFFDQPDGADR